MVYRSSMIKRLRKEQMRCYQNPRYGMPKRQFDQISAHNWAVEELISRLEKTDHILDEGSEKSTTFDLDFMIFEDFVKRMDEYACKSEQKSHWYSAARDAGEWVLDVLIS